ncbi:MAG TPA: MDR family oxidoreductase [Acidimicrobiales bacterium]|nr:MDR family oxidoreductase [Acidimicrobiales bacterium]
MSTFSAVVAREAGKPAAIEQISDADLPEQPVTVAVAFSSLNYKDGLATTGKPGVVRSYPMICGIDLAGTVEESSSPEWQKGTEVVVTGWGLSEVNPGGYTQRQRLSPDWLLRRPEGLDLRQTMAIGTAGLTAMLCVLALEDAGVTPGGDQAVLVTGAGGGVGSVAVALLSKLGYGVAASTGRSETHDYLRSLGASTIVGRDELSTPGRPLDKQRWAGAVDTVGSQTLATVLAQTTYGGAVAACGLAGGSDLPTTVMPFILRGVKLLGVESVSTPNAVRRRAWERLARDLPAGGLEEMTTVEPLGRVPELGNEILAGRTRGRVVIDVRG